MRGVLCARRCGGRGSRARSAGGRVVPPDSRSGRAHGDHDGRGARRRHEAPPGAASVHRRGRAPVRVLHERNGHLRGRAPRARSPARRDLDPRRARRQSLPLRRVRPRDTSDPTSSGVVLMWDRREAERLEQRIRVERDGTVTALSGKIDFGQGLRTAFAQIVADELDVPIERVRVVLGDTDQVPFDFGTFGSHSVAQEAPALRSAAAFARRELIERAAARLGVPADRLDTDRGAVTGGDRRVAYADLVDGTPLAGPIPEGTPLMPASRRRYAGRPLPRVEARDIVTGRARYVADVRLPGMLRGAIARPPARGAKLRALGDAAARKMPGVAAVVRQGDVVGVVAERDGQARAAAGALLADWEIVPVEGPSAEVVMRDDAGVDGAISSATATLSRTYVLPPIANAPIGPSAAVADVRDGEATLYVGTHRPFGVREQVAKAIG